MPNELPAEFIDLMELLLEGNLDEAGEERLAEMVRTNPELLKAAAGQLDISSALNQVGRADDDFAQRTASHVMKIAAEGKFEFSGRVLRRVKRRRLVKIVAAAAVISLAALPFFLNSPASAPEVATLVRMSAENQVISSMPVLAGSRFEETSGLIRFDFKNGAVVAIQAPARLTVISAMEIALESGRLNGWCPVSAHGFKVRTASAALTDLGTSFGVSATADGKSGFMVLDGQVEVEQGSEKMTLGQGDAVEASKGNDLKSVTFDPSGFKRTWPLANGILSTRGAVIPANPDIPERLIQMESDDKVLVIPERREVPFNRPILAEILHSGTIPGDFDGTIHTLQPVAGKRVSSFVIRYNPVGVFSEERFLRFEGEVTFDRPVLAIACQNAALADGDAVFSTAEWTDPLRGIELIQRLNPPDSVTLSADRRTVKVVFYAGVSTDDIRVILEDF